MLAFQEELEQYLQGSGENYWIGLTRWNWEWKVIAGKPVYNLGESNSDRSGSIKATSVSMLSVWCFCFCNVVKVDPKSTHLFHATFPSVFLRKTTQSNLISFCIYYR